MDARPRRPISEAEITAFWDDGVVCLRRVLDPALVAAMEGPVDEALRSTASADLSEMGRALTGTTDEGDDTERGRFVAGTDHWRHQPEMRAFACDSPLPAIVGALLRATKINLWEDSVLVKEPGTAEQTMWHQDLSYFHVSGDQLCTTWVPLDPVTAETGAMRFVRGSHRWGAVYRPNLFVTTMPIPDTEGDDVPDVDGSDFDVVSFDLEPGDLTVHHAATLHAAGGNRSATTRRRAISVRYCGDDARYRVRPGAPLKPHHHAVRDGDPLDGPDCPVVWVRE